MPPFTVKPVPKRRHVDLGSALVAVPAAASKIASTEGAGATAITVTPSTDIIFEILSRLPVKTLCRFRCASKQWHSLISGRAFVAAHESRAEPLLVGRFSGRSLQLMDMDGNLVRTIECSALHGCSAPPRMLCTSLDGLACFAFAHRSGYLRVIDIATGETLLTQSDPYCCETFEFCFGRTAISQVYKVVRLSGSGCWFNQCQVLTLGDGAVWREAQSPTKPFCIISQKTSVAIHGVLHILVRFQKIVLCFDLEREEWTKTIKCPAESMDDSLSFDKARLTMIAELNGALCLAQTDLYIDIYSCTDIWLLNDSGKDIWSKAYTIRMGPTVDLVRPLRMMRDGRKLLFCYIDLVTVRPVLKVYDPRAKTCREVVVTATGLADIMGLCYLPLDRFI